MAETIAAKGLIVKELLRCNCRAASRGEAALIATVGHILPVRNRAEHFLLFAESNFRRMISNSVSFSYRRIAMKVEQSGWTVDGGWTPTIPGALGESAQLVLVFAATGLLRDMRHTQHIRQAYPRAHVLGCSTAGEI